MGGNDLNKQFEALKKQFMDLVGDLHAQKLAIPAGILVVAIFGAIFVLPKSSVPPPPTTTTPAVDTSTASAQPKTVSVARVSLVGVTPLDDNNPLAASSNPFTGSTGYKCTRVGKGEPKEFNCMIGDLLVRVICPAGNTSGICGDPVTGGGGATGGGGGSTGSTGGDSGGGSTGSTGGGTKKKAKAKTTYYTSTVKIDSTTYKNTVAGDTLPNTANALALYAGTNDKNTKAVFIAADGVTVTGVTVDPELGNFELAKNKSATLTDALGVSHKLTVTAITKVTK